MKEIGAYEARTHLARLLDEVRDGERIVITKHGTPVAVLVPPTQVELSDVRDAVAAIRAFRRDKKIGNEESLRAMIDAGRM